jgi:hypothetical protein
MNAKGRESEFFGFAEFLPIRVHSRSFAVPILKMPAAEKNEHSLASPGAAA